MKCDELKKQKYCQKLAFGDEVYLAKQVDAAIAELKADVNNLLMQNRELCQALQAMYSAEEYMKLQAEKDREIALLKERICNGDVSRLTWIDDCIAKDKEIAELKKNLEDAKATAYADSVDAGMRERRLKRALLLARAERYKMREFIAREEGNLCNQMSWSRFLRERTYSQWVDQLLRIANLANKLQNKCRAKAEEYK